MLLAAQTPVSGWLEAFAAHPRIGDVEALRSRFGAFVDSSRREQAASAPSDAQLQVQAETLILISGSASRCSARCACRSLPTPTPNMSSALGTCSSYVLLASRPQLCLKPSSPGTDSSAACALASLP